MRARALHRRPAPPPKTSAITVVFVTDRDFSAALSASEEISVLSVASRCEAGVITWSEPARIPPATVFAGILLLGTKGLARGKPTESNRQCNENDKPRPHRQSPCGHKTAFAFTDRNLRVLLPSSNSDFDTLRFCSRLIRHKPGSPARHSHCQTQPWTLAASFSTQSFWHN